MAPWLAGKLLSPFFALLMVWLITAPVRRWIERGLPEGRLKRWLLIDRDAQPWKFGLWWFVICFGSLAAFGVYMSQSG